MVKDHTVIWKECLNIVRKSIDFQPYKTWFEPIKPVRFENEVLTIQVPNKFFYEWLEEHYVGLLKKAIKQEIGHNGRLEYQIMVDNHKKIGVSDSVPKSIKEEEIVKTFIPNPFVIPGIKKIRIDSQLNANYNFDQFVQGECNRFPVSAGLAIAKKPGGTAFNPLIVYGDVGWGKLTLYKLSEIKYSTIILKSRFYMSQQKNSQIKSFRQ
jgi:chromosomal replication initiator protein